MTVKSYNEFKEQTVNRFKDSFPEEDMFSKVGAEWLLCEFALLLEKYELFKSMRNKK